MDHFFINEAKARKDQEASLTDFIEQRCVALRHQIAEESKQRFENVDILEQALQQDVPQLQEKVNSMKMAREE